MRTLRLRCSLFFLLLSGPIASLLAAQDPAPATGPADAIYYDGNILTGDGLDTDRPQRVSAIAVRNGMVVGTAGDRGPLAIPPSSPITNPLTEFKGPQTEMVDLHGAFLMPGLNDAHVHFGEAARIELSVNLIAAASLAEMLARVNTAAVAAAPGAWLAGGGWDHTLWERKTLPTRGDLDAVTAGHPAIFTRVDDHIAVVNSAALTAAGINRGTPDPQGGKIDRDANGDATGILREDSAMALVRSHIPPPTDAVRRRGLEHAIADAISHGLTSVQDNSDMRDLDLYAQMEREGKLPVRITEWLPFNAPLDTLKQLRAAYPDSDRRLHAGMLKGFMDGSLGSRTAAMKAAYSDDPGNTGIPRYDPATLNKMTVERAEAGFQIGFHAIGDRANSMALDAFSQAVEARRRMLAAAPVGEPGARIEEPQASIPVKDNPRYRIEHAQVVDPADIPRFKQLGIIASMQPSHLLTDMSWALQRLGPQRARYSYAWKAFLDGGVPLAFGTDYPVEPITPFRGIYSAVTRQNEAGTMTYFPDNKLTIGQAIYAYTQGSAYAEFAESWKGKLAPGYVADFIVLDRDLTRIPPAEILNTKVLRTVVAGKTVYVANTGIPYDRHN